MTKTSEPVASPTKDDLIGLAVWCVSIADHHADVLTPRQIKKLYEASDALRACAARLYAHPPTGVERALRHALEEVANPIAIMKKRAEAMGRQIDGMMANQLARDPAYLQNIAKEALSASPSAESGAEDGELEKLVEPWKYYQGDPPEYDHPLRCVFESGAEYAVQLLSKTLKAEGWEYCDGTEEFDGDLGGTLFNIVLAAMPKDEHGDEIHPNELPAVLTRDHLAALSTVAEQGEEKK